MKAIVIYNSQTGFTKRYAQWIAEELSCDCVSFKEKRKVNPKDYDTIIFGSWFHAASVLKRKWLFRLRQAHPDKKYIAFATGASPVNSPDIPLALEKNFPKGCAIQTFYFQGGLDYDKMGFVSKTMMKMLCRSIKNKKDRTPQEDEMLNMISHSYDCSDRKYITDLVAAARA